MSKFHINKHGVPAPCKATKGNCPFGGESGSENHFDTVEDAQAYADKVNEANHSLLPGMGGGGGNGGVKGSPLGADSSFETQDEAHKAADEQMTKLYGEHNLEIVGDDTEKPQRNVVSEGRELASTVDTRIKSVEEPKLSNGPGSIKSYYDLDTQIELRNEYITTHEHDPVENVQSMFDHVASKSGKLYRYNDTDNPYLETHEYNFDENIRNHRNYLEKEKYFDEDYGYGEKGRKDFERNVADHRELYDYTSKLAIEYGKDFEKNVVLSGKYSPEEEKQIQEQYKSELANKVREFLAD